jgi:hypothetical protein
LLLFPEGEEKNASKLRAQHTYKFLQKVIIKTRSQTHHSPDSEPLLVTVAIIKSQNNNHKSSSRHSTDTYRAPNGPDTVLT